MPPRRKLCILSSPEDSDHDDVVSPQTTAQFSLQNMTLNSSNKTQPIQDSQRDEQSQRNRTSVAPIPLDISSSDDEQADFFNRKSPNSNGVGNSNIFRHEGRVIRDSQNPDSNVGSNGTERSVIRNSQNPDSNGGVNVSVFRHKGSVIRDFGSPGSTGLANGDVNSENPDSNGGVNVSVFRHEGSVIRDFESPGSIGVSNGDVKGSVDRDSQNPLCNGEVGVNVFRHEGSVTREPQNHYRNGEVNVNVFGQDSRSPNSNVRVNVNVFRQEGIVSRDSQNPNSNGGVDVNIVREERGGIRDSQNSNSNGGVNVNVNRYEGSVIRDSQNFNSNEGVDVNVVRDGRSGTGGGVGLILRNMGLNLRREWFESCMNGLLGGVRGFESLDDCRKAKMCFEQFLKADMNYCGGGVLPENVNSLHLVELKGPFILQVDEIVNISCPLRSRYQKAAPGMKRCLKLSMTDGVQRVFGMEYRPIGALDVFAPAGMKVAISNVCVRHGLLMLVPEVFAVLGGLVEELEAARERLVQEVNKPPRGKRTRTGVVPPLGSRATIAAWPQGNANAPVQANDSHMDRSVHLQTAEQGTASDILASGRTREHTVLPSHREGGTTSLSASDVDGAALHTPTFRAPALDRARVHSALRSHQEAETTTFSASDVDGAALHTPTFRAPAIDRAREHSALRSHQEAETTTFSASAFDGAASYSITSHAPASDRAREHTTLQSHQETGTTSFSASSLNGAALHTPTHMMTENITPSSRRHSMETNYSAEAMDVEEINMADGLEIPYILSGEKEIPFTYLASLLTKWATEKAKGGHVQGMIKAALIGVKRFQYKETDKYELLIHVDDGSLISEIQIDHSLVERLIGHPPQVVAAGILSPDEDLVLYMKKKLTQFQKFLTNFEGMMYIQFNEACSLPLVTEMNEGCTISDAWKLLRRLQPSTSTRQPQHSQVDPIELSP